VRRSTRAAARFHTGTPVRAIEVANGRPRLATGNPALRSIERDQVVVCAGQLRKLDG
jgi:hypothetical protein